MQRLLTTATLTALVMMAGQAYASCGDYVVWGNHVEPVNFLHVGLHDLGADRQTPVETPCHGPNCNQRRVPSRPAPAPTSSAPERRQEAVQGIWLPGDSDSYPPRFERQNDDLTCGMFYPRIDRPPRLA